MELTDVAFFEVGFFVDAFLVDGLGLDAATFAFAVEFPEVACVKDLEDENIRWFEHTFFAEGRLPLVAFLVFADFGAFFEAVTDLELVFFGRLVAVDLPDGFVVAVFLDVTVFLEGLTAGALSLVAGLAVDLVVVLVAGLFFVRG